MEFRIETSFKFVFVHLYSNFDENRFNNVNTRICRISIRKKLEL